MDSGLVAPAHTEPALKKLLAAAGCDVPRSVLIRNSGNCPLPGDVPVAFQRSQLPYPVMVKGVSPSITHKTRAGLVWPNVSSLDMLLSSLDKLTQNAQTAGAELEAVFVEEMIGAGLDLVVSLFESRLGTTIMVGRGGVDVETSQNIRFVVMPLAPTDLDRLTRDIQLSVDSETLTDLIHRVYGVYQNAGLALLELNPVRFLSDGRAVVLDAVGR
jgi:succinyl-CoA synthetase beta subunit